MSLADRFLLLCLRRSIPSSLGILHAGYSVDTKELRYFSKSTLTVMYSYASAARKLEGNSNTLHRSPFLHEWLKVLMAVIVIYNFGIRATAIVSTVTVNDYFYRIGVVRTD
jgi:hypothetical protein